MTVRITQKWAGQISWAQNMLSPGLSPIVSVPWCVALNVISDWPHSEQRLIMCEHVWWSWDGGKRVHGTLQGVCFQRGFSADFHRVRPWLLQSCSREYYRTSDLKCLALCCKFNLFTYFLCHCTNKPVGRVPKPFSQAKFQLIPKRSELKLITCLEAFECDL